MMDDANEEEIAIRRCLVKWINCTVNREAIQSLADLVTETNNRTISEILYMIDQDAEKEIVQPHCESVDVEQVFTNVISYLSGFNRQQLYDVISVRQIATERDEGELAKLVTILLYSAVQCNNCQSFIESITALDTKTQHWIKFLIESVMNKLGPDGTGLTAACLGDICRAKKTEELPVGDGQPCSVITSVCDAHSDSVFSNSPIISLMSSPQMKVKHNQYSQSLALEKLHQKNNRLLRNLEELRHLQSENELDIAEKNRQIDNQSVKISELKVQVSALNQIVEENESLKHFKIDYEKVQKECERLKQKVQNLEEFKNQCEDFRESSTKFYEERNQFEKERESVEQMKSQCVKYKEQNHQLDFKLKELEAALIRRDKMITDLRKEKIEALQAASQSRELLKELNGDSSLITADVTCKEEQSGKDTDTFVLPNIEAQVIELKFENQRLKEKVAEVNQEEFMEMKDRNEGLLQSKKAFEEQYVEVKSQLLELQDTLSYKESQLKQREEAFAKQHEISQESIRSFQQQFEIKNKEIHRLQSELDAVTSENKAHITAVENRRVANAREMEGLQQMFTDQLKNIEEEFTQRVDCVTRERDQIKQEYAQELQERDSHCENLEKKLTEASKEVEILENERKRLQEDYDDVLKKLGEIKREKENADEKYSKELYQLRDDVIERDVKYYNLEKIKIEQEKLLKKLKADNKKLVKKMENAVGKRESECCELQQTVQELTRQIERVTKEREQVKEAYEELLAAVRKELETEVEQRKAINVEYQQARSTWCDMEQKKDLEMQAVVQEIEALKAEFNARETKLSTEKTSEIQALNEELGQMTEEMNKNKEEMQMEILTLKRENSEKTKVLEEFNNTCQRLKIELTAVEQKLLDTTKTKNLIEEEFQTEKKQLEDEITQLTSQISDVTRALEESRDSHCTEKHRNQEQKDKICSLVTQNAEQQADVDRLVDQVQREKQAFKQLMIKQDELTYILEQKGDELANEINEKQKLKEDLERLAFQLDELKRAHASAIQEMVSSRQEERKTHAQKIEELEKQLKKTCQNLQDAMHDISSLHDEKVNLDKEIVDLRSEKQSLLDSLETERETASKKVTNTLEEASRDIANMQKSFDAELTSWRHKSEAVKQESMNLRAELCTIKKNHVTKLLEVTKEKRESEEKMEEDARKLREDLQSYQSKLENANEACSQLEVQLKKAKDKESDFNELQKNYSVLESKCQELGNRERCLEDEKLSLKQALEKEVEQWRNQADELKKTVKEVEEKKTNEILKLEKEAVAREVKMSTELEEMKQKLEEANKLTQQSKEALKDSEEFKALAKDKEEALLCNLESKECQVKEYAAFVEEKSKLIEKLEEMCIKAKDENEILREKLQGFQETLEEERSVSRRQGTEVRSLDVQLRHANDQIRKLKSHPELQKKTRVEQPTRVLEETCFCNDSLEEIDDSSGEDLQMHDLDSGRKNESLNQSTRSLASVSSRESLHSNVSGVLTRSATAARQQSMRYLKGSTPPELKTTNGGPYFKVGGQMDLGEEEPGPECDWQRIKELSRRNQSQKMAHLRTSYPVEMTQVPPVSMVTEERLRSGNVSMKSLTPEKLATSRKRKSLEIKNPNVIDRHSKTYTASSSDSCISFPEKRSRTSRFADRFSSTFSSFRGSKSKSNDDLSKSFTAGRDAKEVTFQEADSSIDPRRQSVAFSIEMTPKKTKKVNRRRTITRSTATTQLVQENHRQTYQENLKKNTKKLVVGQRYPLRAKQTNK